MHLRRQAGNRTQGIEGIASDGYQWVFYHMGNTGAVFDTLSNINKWHNRLIP
jgi:hypothetical protein